MPLKKTDYAQPQLTEQSNKQIEQLVTKTEELTRQLLAVQTECDNYKQSVMKLDAENERLLKLSRNEQELSRRIEELTIQKQSAETEVRNMKGKLKQAEERIAYAQSHNKPASTIKDCETCDKEKYGKLIRKYESKLSNLDIKYTASFLVLLLYSLLTTIYPAIVSKALRIEFKEFFIGVCNLLKVFGVNLVRMAHSVSQVQIIDILIVILVGGVIGVIGLIGIIKFIGVYRDYFMDNTSLAITLISLATIVYFADWFKTWLPLNLILVLVLVQIIQVITRYVIQERM